jgi:hypothetical protein
MNDEEPEKPERPEEPEIPEIEKRRKRTASAHADAEELREVAKALPELFGALNESIPKLISGLIGSVYSPETARNMATAIGQFYSKLIEEGIPEEVALDMTKKFVGALDFKKMISMISDEGKSKWRKEFEDEDEE